MLGENDDKTIQKILSGTLALLEEFGLRRLTVEDIARRIGISRVTIYRRFANKDTLVRAVLLRELRRFFAAIDETVAGLETTEERLTEGFAFALQFLNNHALLNRFLRSEPELLLPHLTVDAGPVLAAAREFLAEHLDREIAERRLAPLDTQIAAELLARLVLSFFLTPESAASLRSSDEARRFARTYLAPVLLNAGARS